MYAEGFPRLQCSNITERLSKCLVMWGNIAYTTLSWVCSGCDYTLFGHPLVSHLLLLGIFSALQAPTRILLCDSVSASRCRSAREPPTRRRQKDRVNSSLKRWENLGVATGHSSASETRDLLLALTCDHPSPPEFPPPTLSTLSPPPFARRNFSIGPQNEALCLRIDSCQIALFCFTQE